MIEIYLLCQTHAYLDQATLSSDKDFYGFQSCQNEGRVASGFAIEIFVMYFGINQDALQSMRYDPIKLRNVLNQRCRYSLDSLVLAWVTCRRRWESYRLHERGYPLCIVATIVEGRSGTETGTPG
ncbi:unnamed protein product [Xylocopa violacea]|uniref:Uncharacterized protein n=1 Tax=Xylocopa violacea TaxID=135666 RepID=A0ABP1N3T4_XYLVO